MRKLLNTLFVTTQNAYLAREGDNLLVRVDQETRARFPVHTLEGVVAFGVVNASPPLMHLCMERGVAITFLSENGRFMGSVQGMTRGNVLLRREQYRQADSEPASAAVARNIVASKIANQRAVLLRAVRDHGGTGDASWGEVTAAGDRLRHLAEKVLEEENLNTIRGHEGEAGDRYFSVFDHLITAQKEGFRFRGRNRRPPLDNINALLSFLYTLLAHDTASALEAAGLDACVGFLHRDRAGRKSLALDIMEEFRPHLCDRLALNLVNRRQIDPRGFVQRETGAVEMDSNTRKTILQAWQERKRESIQHPFLKESVLIGLLPHIQALLLSRYIRGDLGTYPAFLWKT